MGNIQNGAACRNDKRRANHPTDDQPSMTTELRPALGCLVENRPAPRIKRLRNLRKLPQYSRSSLISLRFSLTNTLACIRDKVNRRHRNSAIHVNFLKHHHALPVWGDVHDQGSHAHRLSYGPGIRRYGSASNAGRTRRAPTSTWVDDSRGRLERTRATPMVNLPGLSSVVPAVKRSPPALAACRGRSAETRLLEPECVSDGHRADRLRPRCRTPHGPHPYDRAR